MAGPETVEFLSFRRTFTLLMLLVVLPSAGLSGFGVVAIINERAAVEKRVETLWRTRLDSMQTDLQGQLERVQVTRVAPLELRLDDLVLTELGFAVNEHGEVSCSDAKLQAAIASIAPELQLLPERPVFFSLASQAGTSLVVALRSGPHIEGARVAAGAVELLLRRAGDRVTPSGEAASFALVPVKRDLPEGGVMARFVLGVSDVREAALGPRELAGVALPSPLQDFRLVAYAVGEDPVASASSRNRALYGVLLGVFYVALALGVIYTGRTLYREARLSRLKTDFVSLVSHELRTPLTSIRMFIEMLSLGQVKDPKEMQTVVDLLSKETTRLSAMIESVLDWARIESGRKEYDRERVPVAQVIDTAVAAFRAQRMGATMDVVMNVPAELPKVNVDRDAIAGALLNLLQNAYKYTATDKRIVLRALVDDGHVVLEVEDNGVGIPRRELKRIFDRFYRVDNLLTQATEGSGLGLSIAQRIVMAHGGRISVDSTVGRGSTFRIHLPIAS